MKDILPLDLPPILPDVKKQLKDYLICPERLPIHEFKQNQEFWPREYDISALYNFERAPVGTTLTVQRDPNTGKIIEFREVPVLEIGSTARNSMSLNRAPAQCESIRGDAANFPFWPGGIPNLMMHLPEDLSPDFTNLLTIPPSFSRGIIFENDGCTIFSENSDTIQQNETIVSNERDENSVNLMELIQKEQDLLGLWYENKDNESMKGLKITGEPSTEIDVTEVLPKEQEIPVLKISEVDNQRQKKHKWAITVDIQKPVEDFHERIPDMAHKYPFELDTFQKQAILKLEENCDVFVAAHTSAGKTVVAEYAIALSQKHNTRTIYTSPIKALSNQKYRDFKQTFNDVGLVTGDFQINQTGVCLIMTTEILRSMLYCGSEVIRDLEYVIFDEVHYINDAERGHVWEEILIMLPSHVRIVLLSATVPNAVEFSNWLGQTKQRIVYVISTLQRPVPLQHYLYTGCDGKTKDERFLIIDGKGNFNIKNFRIASSIVNQRLESQNRIYNKNKQKEQTAWSGLIDHLKRNDLLPVIVFTFSRIHCDDNAQLLHRFINLTTEKEKSKIRAFYQHCIKRLKVPDQKLPQIVVMQEILIKGIGVHHSGVLPIIKEIVEMLFQNGLIKILFATETFAMGVNMPARTVIFNGIMKFDGSNLRILKPAEYIQMAGRAGRRGLDKTGTVIIRCHSTIPDIFYLRNMTQGEPQLLKSQFRLTYGMLLSLLRVESLSIESMMTHSFHETDHVSRADQLQVELKKAEEQLQIIASKKINNIQNLTKYYHVSSEYIKQWNNVQPKILSVQRAVKTLVPGAVLLISYKWHLKKLAMLLTSNMKKEITYKVLVLNQRDEEPVVNEKPEDWYQMLSFTCENYYVQSSGEHEVLEIKPHNIISVSSNKFIKLDADLIIKDWEKRQIPRFRDDPRGQTCQQAIQELTVLSKDGFKIEFCKPVKDFQINDIDLMQQIMFLENKKADLLANLVHTKIANFESQFAEVYDLKHLEEKVENIRYSISHKSLTLYPEYISRIEVLKTLRYINDQKRVDLKGRVACGMGMNELLVTELVFRNTLTNLQPAEIAALLSALVFQAKSNVEPTLTPILEKGQKEIESINAELEKLEMLHHICSPGVESNLNFKLVEVIYKWAQEEPFADIMELTDVQEGIIVRCIQQLNETLKDVKEAAMIIGDPVLQTKMDEASNAIKRDIVFAASLYT